jgi:hypothetical protein
VWRVSLVVASGPVSVGGWKVVLLGCSPRYWIFWGLYWIEGFDWGVGVGWRSGLCRTSRCSRPRGESGFW